MKAVTFADNTQISSWAKDAVKSMQQAGILAGKNENKFDPKGTATRAEVATVLRRFVEIVIDPQAANGWQQNDSVELLQKWEASEGLALRGSEVVLAGQGHRNDVCRRLEADRW